MDSYDVLIVGGGPAGSSCAWALRHSGLRVAILDKQVFPRDKICGGWITPAVLSNLEIDAADYARHHVLQPITGFRVGAIGGAALDIQYRDPVSYGIRRCEFDNYLLRRSGAQLLLGSALTSLQRVPEGLEGWAANEGIRARVIVGAGGHFCPVARFLGGKESSPVVAQEVEFQLDACHCRVQGNTPELYFCSDMKGYGWCFRKGDVLNIGLGRADPLHLPAHVADFLNFLKSAGRICFDVPPLRGHAYLLHGTSTRSVAGDGYLLAGDAAGLASLQSGEGILPAVDSGLLAAKSILARDFSAYPAALAPPPQSLIMRMGQALQPPLAGFVARNLLKTRWFVRDVVINEWFLHLCDHSRCLPNGGNR
ncbi:MAG TPA: NAD(P)/FAD-dependent oxidoreductase [Bryobacteraceae bacterium]|jgi:flavin-dependent dehydrogenase|nr:NAD(P)/FAD-dependent oxidoreductase [Bryobacteraceae bacterium]